MSLPCGLQKIFQADEADTISATRKSLFELFNDGSDVNLIFTVADKSTETAPAHSYMLKQWSGVLAGALDTAAHNNSSNKGGCSKIRIPLYDTNKEDWLLAMEFVYPVTPQPQPTWEVMKTLMLIGNKYSMPALLQRVGIMITHNVRDLDLDTDSELFVWDWVCRLGHNGLTDAATTIVSSYSGKALHELMNVCPAKRLYELSSSTLAPLVIAMQGHLAQTGVQFCRKCAVITGHGFAIKCNKCLGGNLVKL